MLTNRKSYFYLRLTIDLVLLNISFLIAAIYAQSLPILLSRTYMFILPAICSFFWYFNANTGSFYEENRGRYYSFHMTKLVQNVLVQITIAIVFIFLVKEDLFTRNFIIAYGFILFVVISFRILLFKFFLDSMGKKGINKRNMLIIGAGSMGHNFNEVVENSLDYGFVIKGFLDDNKKDNKVLGTISDLNNVIKSENIDEVVVALPDYAHHSLEEIIRICNMNAIRTHIIPDYFKFLSNRFEINMVGTFPVITIRKEPLEEIHWRILKRLFDLTFSILTFILLLSWLFPLLAILIKIDSKGNVFFKQQRIGARNKKFTCYKFRTMISHPDEQIKFSAVTYEDARITKFGKFLRKSNLDELPQFINVLLGDMSIVGPRPHAIAYHEKYKEIVEEIKMRHNVKPGITGWAQVHGLRGDVPDEAENKIRTKNRIQFDLWYIENWSFWLDLQIIFLTIWQMVKGDTKGV